MGNELVMQNYSYNYRHRFLDEVAEKVGPHAAMVLHDLVGDRLQAAECLGEKGKPCDPLQWGAPSPVKNENAYGNARHLSQTEINTAIERLVKVRLVTRGNRSKSHRRISA